MRDVLRVSSMRSPKVPCKRKALAASLRQTTSRQRPKIIARALGLSCRSSGKADKQPNEELCRQLRRPTWEASHGMVQQENIDSGHSNSKLGASSRRGHRNLDHLQIHCLISRWLGLPHTCAGHVCLRYCLGCFYYGHAAQQLVGLYA